MYRKKTFSKIAALGLSVCMAMSATTIHASVPPSEKVSQNTDVMPQNEKDYIVMTRTEQQADALEQKYDSPDILNTNGEDCLQENQMASVTLTDREAEKLSAQKNITFVEEDVVVAASHTNTENDRIRKKNPIEKVQKSNSEEWNLRMIHADHARKIIGKKRNKGKKGNKDRVRIAILDSGVDYNTDMNIAATFSLVPGEEDMSPLFMDATGHGTSVAGLAAAKDNNRGITGVDPYAEIYSIRVLDDDNCAPVSRVIEGIYMAIEAKADIINMSFGVDTYSQALAQAVRDAENAGILVIAAAGNTGLAKEAGTTSTVQYPAALEEVLAVGSVDKRGDRADDSATGSEISLTAPGELVRSTGMFGSGEVVESGTSLAAPQAAGAAALILERDKDVSPDFVRGLLKASANAYGETDEYGAGLIDVGYALEHYDSFKKQYKEKNPSRTVIPENETKVPVFQKTGCVKGCWSRNNHENLVKNNNEYVKKGARFNDGDEDRYITGKDENGKPLYRYRGMRNHPWWHGYYKKTQKGNYLCNYAAAYLYETRLANAVGKKTTIRHPGLPGVPAEKIQKEIAQIDWKNIFGKVPSNKHKRDFLWGMAIHNLSDTFAHSAVVKGKLIDHTKSDGNRADADRKDICEDRWYYASKAVGKALKKYNTNTEGSWSDYLPVCSQSTFKLVNIYDNIKGTFGEGAASHFKKINVTKK
ncbi:MAG: S8 family serine peptidase [Eubacterium sp.]|nr:S8 family serine peptidase [Eubacterium sp.]